MSSLAVPLRVRSASTGPTAARSDEARKGWRHQDAVALLRKMIEIGELAPGERLREIAISEKLGMSRTPVREAFRTLAAEGLVELLPNRSVVVSEVDRSASADVFTVLGALEGLAATLACERISQEEIDALGALQDELEVHFSAFDRAQYVEVNRRIHALIVEACRSAALITAWRVILPRADRARNANNIARSRWSEAVREHRGIFEAIAARQAAEASRLMTAHFQNGLAHTLATGGAKAWSADQPR
jgi:DNA-binding GntR family transcriptional regulator